MTCPQRIAVTSPRYSSTGTAMVADCAIEEPHSDGFHTSTVTVEYATDLTRHPGLPNLEAGEELIRFPTSTTWHEDDRRAFVGEYPGPCTRLETCALPDGHPRRCAE